MSIQGLNLIYRLSTQQG